MELPSRIQIQTPGTFVSAGHKNLVITGWSFNAEGVVWPADNELRGRLILGAVLLWIAQDSNALPMLHSADEVNELRMQVELLEAEVATLKLMTQLRAR